MQIDLRDLSVSYRDYEDDVNPPILHRKETVVTPDYPGYKKFAKLTQQEEKCGLLQEIRGIKNLLDWQRCLEKHSLEIQDHCLRGRTGIDPILSHKITASRKERKKFKDAKL
jgi:DNA phosphorothioation-associated putative methyltransferase